MDHVAKARVAELYRAHRLQGVSAMDYDRVPDELLLASMPEVALKKILGIRSRRYPNWLYSKLFSLLAWLDDTQVVLPGVFWKIPKWTLVAGTVAS